MLDPDGVIQDAVLAGSIPGERIDAWFGRPWRETVGVGREQIGQMIDEARMRGVAAFGQVTQVFPSGRQLPIEYTAVRLGEGPGLVAVGRNMLAVAAIQSRALAGLHEREQQHWQLRDAETRYRLLFDASHEAVLLLHADGLRIQQANPAAIDAFGLGPDDEFGRDFSAADRRRLQAVLAQARVLGRAPAMMVRAGPSRREWTLRVSLMPSEPVPVFLLQLAPAAETRPPEARPAAPRAAAPRRPAVSLEDLAERLPDGLVIIDDEGIVLRVNPAFLDLIQAGAEGAVVGENLTRWIHDPGCDVGVILGLIRRHRVVRRMLTNVSGSLGMNTAVELSAARNGETRPACIGMLIRNVERRARPVGSPGGAGPGGASRDFMPALPGLDAPADLLGRTPLPQVIRETVSTVERRYIVAALTQAGGNRSAAADLLGMSRQTLYMKLSRYGLDDAGPPGTGRSV